MEIRTGFPFGGKSLEALRDFLALNGLKYDDGVKFSLCLTEDDKIAASGSLDGNILKCIAVSKDFQEEGLAAKVVSGLIDEAARNGIFHLFLFTKPENEFLFGSLGFYPIAKTEDVLLMENKKDGIISFAAAISDAITINGAKGINGAVIMNCNPFTKGHQYLIETAAGQCTLLYIFVVSENKSDFPAASRLALVKAGTSHIPNVQIHPTGPYLISAATFPDYFFKNSVDPKNVNTILDLTVFAEHFARPLGISRRFVGTEPFDGVTAMYNRQMKEFLPRYGIEVVEIDRAASDGKAISASRVRKLLAENKLDEIRKLVPDTTFAYLRGTAK